MAALKPDLSWAPTTQQLVLKKRGSKPVLLELRVNAATHPPTITTVP